MIEEITLAKKAYDAGNLPLSHSILCDAHAKDPANTLVLSNLGKVSAEMGLFAKAFFYCQKILEIDPLNTRAMANSAGILAQSGEIYPAIALLRKARETNPHDHRNHSDLLITLHYASLLEQEVFEEHLAFGNTFEKEHLGKKIPLYGHTKIRIGYITHDIAEHAIWYILRALLPHHNRERFDIYLYWTNSNYDAETDELRKLGDTWRTAQDVSQQELREKILSDEIDVLIDLSGHTGGNVLPIFAERSAPIQMSWFGYMDTTGLTNMDYRITDLMRIPPGREKYYTEKLLYLPDSYAFTPRIATPKALTSLPQEKNGYVTFGSFNAVKKINRPLIDTWSRILTALPTAKLVFVAEKSVEYSEKLRAQFALNGVEQHQIVFEPFRPMQQFLNLVASVDIALDSFPYTGGITTYHALSVGVPSVTLLGPTEYERNCSAIQESVGLKEFTAHTQEEYVSKAIYYANKQDKLREVRATVPHTLGSKNHLTVASLEAEILKLCVPTS